MNQLEVKHLNVFIWYYICLEFHQSKKGNSSLKKNIKGCDCSLCRNYSQYAELNGYIKN